MILRTFGQMLSGKNSMEDVTLQSVRVFGSDCETCLAAFEADCAALGHPHVGTFAVVRDSWLHATCPHGREGVFLEAVEPEPESDDERLERVMAKGHSGGPVDSPEVQKSRWRDLFSDNIDATKNVGYAARDMGRYGSHPQHDGSGED